MKYIKRTCPTSFQIDKIGRILNYSSKKSIIREELIKMSEKHCVYCDCVLHIAEYTPHIEHFKPKKLFFNLENIWFNLFVSCPKCNENKGNKFPKIKPLKPDNLDYNFDYWFEIKWETYEIKPNILRDNNEQKKAQTTIDWLGLNKDSRSKSRKIEYKKYKNNTNQNINDYSYRFLLEI